jgi:hypothetical protein
MRRRPRWVVTEEADCKWRLEISGRFSAQVGPRVDEGYAFATFNDCDCIDTQGGFADPEDARIAAQDSLRIHLMGRIGILQISVEDLSL